MIKQTDLSQALANALRPRVRDDGAAPEGVANHPGELIGLNASLHILVKDTADLLVRHFPGFLWAVKPDQAGGIIDIFCLNFSSSWGYTIRLLELQRDPRMRQVVHAGRELLRRFHYEGTRYDMAKANAVPRNAAGEAIPDLSDMPASRRRDHAAVELAIATGKATIVSVDGEVLVEVRQ